MAITHKGLAGGWLKTLLMAGLASILLFGLCACNNYTAMTYNIRLDLASDSENAWGLRKQALLAQVRDLNPDFLGVQEARPNQMQDLAAAFPDYRYIGIGRDGGKNGEFSAIFYDGTKWSIETEATFWLSSTPEQKSKGWDAAFPRICTYGLFSHRKTGKKLWVFNTHLDHMGSEARRNGLSLIKDTIDHLNTEELPVILMGDMNAEPNDGIFNSITQDYADSRAMSRKLPIGPVATFNGFNMDETPSRRIDYIFVTRPDQFKIQTYSVLRPNQKEPYPSDHFPVIIEFNLK